MGRDSDIRTLIIGGGILVLLSGSLGFGLAQSAASGFETIQDFFSSLFTPTVKEIETGTVTEAVLSGEISQEQLDEAVSLLPTIAVIETGTIGVAESFVSPTAEPTAEVIPDPTPAEMVTVGTLIDDQGDVLGTVVQVPQDLQITCPICGAVFNDNLSYYEHQLAHEADTGIAFADLVGMQATTEPEPTPQEVFETPAIEIPTAPEPEPELFTDVNVNYRIEPYSGIGRQLHVWGMLINWAGQPYRLGVSVRKTDGTVWIGTGSSADGQIWWDVLLWELSRWNRPDFWTYAKMGQLWDFAKEIEVWLTIRNDQGNILFEDRHTMVVI